MAEAPQLRPEETAGAKSSREECQLSRESQHMPTAEGASGANAEEEIPSVCWVEGTQAGLRGDLCLSSHRSCPLREPLSVMHTLV